MKRKIVAIISIFALMISVFCFTPDSNAGVSTLNLTKQKKTISVGQSFQLKLDGIKESKVKWSSSKPSVAEVNKKGIVTGIKSGKTVITGKFKGIKFNITVNVTKVYEKTFTHGDAVVNFISAKNEKFYDGKYFTITFRFTNNSTKPSCFGGSFNDTAYVNGVQQYPDLTYYTWTNVKDGGTVDVQLCYKLSHGDKLEFELSDYMGNKIYFSETYINQ